MMGRFAVPARRRLRGAALAPYAGRMDEPTPLDLSGLKCPLPALRTRKALKALTPGARIEVICTDPMAAIDIPHLVAETGDVIEREAQDAERLIFVIRKAG